MEPMLTIEQVALLTRLSISTIRREWYAERFPAPVKVGARAVRWRLADITSHIESLPAYQRPGQTPHEIES